MGLEVARPGIEPGSLAQDSETLTTKPRHLPLSYLERMCNWYTDKVPRSLIQSGIGTNPDNSVIIHIGAFKRRCYTYRGKPESTKKVAENQKGETNPAEHPKREVCRSESWKTGKL